MGLLYLLLRPLLFAIEPERAHTLVLSMLRLVCALPFLRWLLPRPVSHPSLVTHLFGKAYPTPIGLAAGFDKNATHHRDLTRLGFGFVEIGTVTAEPQAGNDRPRLFRLRKDRALLNRMGFNNDGCERVSSRLVGRDRASRLGVNIGKSKITRLEDAAADYRRSTRALAPFADYLVVNVSSPNTPGLRELQAVSALRPLLVAVQEELRSFAAAPPLFVKVAPDLADEDLDAVADLCLELGLAGIIATNTTVRRDGLRSDKKLVEALGAGGVSGPPVSERARAVLRRLYNRCGSRLVLIAAGGIDSADEAWARITSGASLVQLYTGLVYGGPLLPRRIALGLAERLAAAGLTNIAQAVGSSARDNTITTASTPARA